MYSADNCQGISILHNPVKMTTTSPMATASTISSGILVFLLSSLQYIWKETEAVQQHISVGLHGCITAQLPLIFLLFISNSTLEHKRGSEKYVL